MQLISERPFNAAELSQFEYYRQMGLELLGASASAVPKLLVQAVDEFVDQWQSKRRGLSGMFRSRAHGIEPARALGVVWGTRSFAISNGTGSARSVRVKNDLRSPRQT